MKQRRTANHDPTWPGAQSGIIFDARTLSDRQLKYVIPRNRVKQILRSQYFALLLWVIQWQELCTVDMFVLIRPKKLEVDQHRT